jgi:hypothetical protein
MFYATFNNVSVIYHIVAVGWGGSGGSCIMPLSIFFSHLPHLCCRQGGFGGFYITYSSENKEALLLAVFVLMFRFG